MHWDKMHFEPDVQTNVKANPAKNNKRSDRRELKLVDAVCVGNISAGVVMKQPIICSPFVLQASLCDSGVPGKVFPLYESWGGSASVWHNFQAETSCGTRDQNPCPTGAALSWVSISKNVNISRIILISSESSENLVLSDCPYGNVLWRLSSLLLRWRWRPWGHSGERLHFCLWDTRVIQTRADPLQTRR